MGARDLLADLAGSGFSIAAEGDKLVIRPWSKLTDDMRSALREAKPELLALLAPPERPQKLTPAELDLAHAEPWPEATCARVVARVSRFLRLGFNGADADDLAERQHLLDVQAEGRTLCVTCTHLAGHATAGWRCRQHRDAGVAAELPAALVTLPQRCAAFRERTR